MIKPLLTLALAVLLQQGSCNSTSGPTPLKQADTLPAIACDQPYVAQLLTGGTPPYHITINNIILNNVTLNNFPSGLGFKSPDGKSVITPQSGVEFDTNGYLVGMISCSDPLLLNSTQPVQINIAGTIIKILPKG